MNAENGESPSNAAARNGHLNTVKASWRSWSREGRKAAERPRRAAMAKPPDDSPSSTRKRPKKGEELLEKMNTAKCVHVISTRYQGGVDDGAGQGQGVVEKSCDPFSRPAERSFLENGGVFVFDPNGTMRFEWRQLEERDAIWLLNCWRRWVRKGKRRARHPDHRSRRPEQPKGLSKMQRPRR